MQYNLHIPWAWVLTIYPMTQDTVHAEKGYVEMLDFHVAALLFLTGHGIKSRTHACAEITHLPNWCTIRAWKALGLWPRSPQALPIHLIRKCAISAWAWVLAILL